MIKIWRCFIKLEWMTTDLSQTLFRVPISVSLALPANSGSDKSEKSFYFYEKLANLFNLMGLFNFCLLFIPPGYVYTMPLEHYLLRITNITPHWTIKASSSLLVSY